MASIYLSAFSIPRNNFSEKLVNLALISLLLFFFIIKSWVSSCFFFLLVISLVYIKKTTAPFFSFRDRTLRLFFISLSIPVLSILWSQIGRGDWLLRAFDGPSRFILSIPIVLFFIHKRIAITPLISYSAPISLLLTTVYIHLNPENSMKWGGRFATAFVDPNAFGTYAAIFTLFCLFNIDFNNASKRNYLLLLLHLSGVLAGLYLTVGSGTRVSLLALVFPTGLWLYLNTSSLSFTPKLLIIISFSLLVVSAYYIFLPSLSRLSNSHIEIEEWLNHSNIDTSIGIRLSIWKMSIQLFLHNPFFGYGDQAFSTFLNQPWFSDTASEAARKMLICCGPHNELLAQLLRSGLLGAASFLCLLIFPFVYFFKNAFNKNNSFSRPAQIGLAYISILLFSSISLEVFNLKYTSSFYAIIMGALIAQITNASESTKTLK